MDSMGASQRNVRGKEKKTTQGMTQYISRAQTEAGNCIRGAMLHLMDERTIIEVYRSWMIFVGDSLGLL